MRTITIHPLSVLNDKNKRAEMCRRVLTCSLTVHLRYQNPRGKAVAVYPFAVPFAYPVPSKPRSCWVVFKTRTQISALPPCAGKGGRPPGDRIPGVTRKAL